MNISLRAFLLLALVAACLGEVQREKHGKHMRTHGVSDFFGPSGKITPEKMKSFKESMLANKERWTRAASNGNKKPRGNKKPTSGNKPGNDGQIYGGSEGTENMPWMAYVETVNADNQTVHTCSGFIMNETKIVTAAHCLERGNRSYVTVGSIDRTSADAITLVIPYTQWIVPKEFIMNGLEHDVAVFNLSSPLTFGTKIKALGLPPASMYKKKGFTMDSQPITLYGFGHAESNDPDCPAPDGPAMIFNIAQTTTANSTKYCNAIYKQNYLYLAKTHSCTTNIFNDTTPGACDADAGGPVTFTVPGAPGPVLVGIISFNDACFNKIPVAVTDANKVMKFLTKALNMKQPK